MVITGGLVESDDDEAAVDIHAMHYIVYIYPLLFAFAADMDFKSFLCECVTSIILIVWLKISNSARGTDNI